MWVRFPPGTLREIVKKNVGSCRSMDRLPGFEPGDVGSIPTGNISISFIQIPLFFHIIVDWNHINWPVWWNGRHA